VFTKRKCKMLQPTRPPLMTWSELLVTLIWKESFRPEDRLGCL